MDNKSDYISKKIAHSDLTADNTDDERPRSPISFEGINMWKK